MALNRENEFPATSIGRSSGIRVMQQASVAHEAHAHPLLSPGPNSPTASEQGHVVPTSGGSATSNANGGPRYVPYTPRQRVTPTAATTGTTVHPPSPQQQQGDATSKLQLMHLKAAAQGIGLDSGTLGWSILEKLVLDVEVSEEWVEVWTAITSGKATLLLPLESSFTNEKITADFVKDHVVLCDGPSRNHAPIVTLSGLRGTLQGETLTLRSTINPSSKLFQDLLNPSTRTTALALLPDLPNPLPDISPVTYPQLNVPSYSPSLPLPPRTQVSTKPPLPPRPANRPNAPAHASTSRISIPFASLFGGGQSKASTPVPASPPASVRSFDSTHDGNAPVDLSAFTVDRRIVRREIAKGMNNALKGELKAALATTSSLGNIPVPSWVAERVHDMTSNWYPFIKKPPAKLKKLNNEKNGKDNSSNGYVINTIEESPEDAAERLQDFYLSLEQDMRVGGTPFISRRKDKDADSDAENDKDREKREQNKMESETRIRDVMEAVERTITSLFYDRLFMQTTTDDANHDEALSSRIAALNMLDLGLGHLGIEVGESVNEPELDAVVKACGDMLTGLDSCRSPGHKSSILVAAHKIIVGGLSKLPPIRLISENDVKDDDQEDDLRTAKPTFTNEGELNPQPQPSKPLGVHASEAIPEAYNTSPPPSIRSSSTEPPVTDNAAIAKTSSSKVKSLPPLLSLEGSRPPSVSDASSSPPARLEVSSSQKEPTPVSGDVLLPMIIFSVVKANPPHLLSNLLFTQRFRNQSVGGEESYCLINLLAVAEFLENVDMAGLGLGDSDKVMSTADLTPIPLTRSPVTAETPLEPADAQGLRGRVGQQVDAITDSANKVITGVVDSSFGILRSFMPSNQNSLGLVSAPGTPASRPGFGLLRRESGFSIASLAASLPITGRSRANTATEESGQQLVPVSRPSSVRSRISRTSLKIKLAADESQDDDDSDDGDESAATGDEESEADEEEEEGEDEAEEYAATSDARSIRSFESMLSASKEKSRGARARKSLSDRLASVSALASLKGSEPSSRRTSLLHPSAPRHGESVSSSRAGSPVQSLHLAPPKQRFIECTADDLRLSEVGELLRDYRRLVEGIRAVGGFDE